MLQNQSTSVTFHNNNVNKQLNWRTCHS